MDAFKGKSEREITGQSISPENGGYAAVSDRIVGINMPLHTAKTLFDLNISSAKECIALYNHLVAHPSPHDHTWLLRSSVVFSVSALDTYFHDKVKYRVGRFDFSDMPEDLRAFPVELHELEKWSTMRRHGNFFQRTVTKHYSIRPLQKKKDIEDAFRLIGVKSLWNTIEPDNDRRELLLAFMSSLIKRRNQIAHEGDRNSSRKGGKKLREITKEFAEEAMVFCEDIVLRIEGLVVV